MSRFHRTLNVIGLTHLVAMLSSAALKGVDQVVKNSIMRTEGPQGLEGFGADLDELVRMWRRRGTLDSDIKLELARKISQLQ